MKRGQLFLMEVMIRTFIICGMVLWYHLLPAQENSGGGFDVIGFSPGARNSALSESNGADHEGELSGWNVNPAGLNAGSWSDVSLHSVFFPGGISFFSVNGLILRDSVWPVAAGLSYASFGENIRYDAEGNSQGVFPAYVSGFNVGTSRLLWEDWHLGINMIYDWRRIDLYHSHVLRFSAGAVYRMDELTSFGMTLHNTGYEIVPFYEYRTKPSPDLSLYWQQRLRHLPFTFFMKMQKLNQWNRMIFENPYDPGTDWIGGQEKEPSRAQDFASELMRHLVLGGEFGFGMPEKVWLRFSYDHWKNQQLSIPGIRSLDGVALGLGIQLKLFRLDYTWERLYYDAGGHRLSLAFRIRDKERRARGF